ncbi:hypothetical protein MKZ38_007036 [Zalerion maritima]|uniref:Uncharacterized protein n=1 Tax=Zalerion maritima TaxID=339359 RepID=A0AAD5WW28_9PEZI|nr:hypothetical protein MKZ38_007036 [Zalerion maritima]
MPLRTTGKWAAADSATSPKLNSNGIPSFDSLPWRDGDPPHSAWGLYGSDDEQGTVNRLTDERVKDAAKNEIQTGERVSLNLRIDAQGGGSSFFHRKPFHQNIFRVGDFYVNDEEWTFNSQVSSQWDGPRHFGYQKDQKFYNGVTMEDIHGTNEKGEKSCALGISTWSEKGIVGRGILVDYHSWRLKQTDPAYKSFDPFSSWAIPLGDIKKCLQDQSTEVKFGDILLIRSGFQATFATKSPEQLASLHGDAPNHPLVGVEQSEDMLRWIWDNFSAVAGDQPTFEVWPTQKEWLLHEVLLGGWACPLGEWFDLEALGRKCQEKKRWSFFLASEPCNVPGGVAR